MLQRITDYIRKLRFKYDPSNERNLMTNTSYRNTEEENKIGRIALVAIQELIKIQHIKNGGWKGDGIMRMDGNADNYHELRNYKIPTQHTVDEGLNELLTQTAKKLLRYGS